jgi:hypothetical protein
VTRLIVLLALLGFSAACGSASTDSVDTLPFYKEARRHNIEKILPNPLMQKGINDAFLPYVYEFEKNWGRLVKDLPINFSHEVKGDTAAQCIFYFNGSREILVNQYSWEHSLIESSRETAIFHELGHCMLGRIDHIDDVIPYHDDPKSPERVIFVPKSIMNSNAFILFYMVNKPYYMAELFSRPNPGFSTTLGLEFVDTEENEFEENQ